MSSEDLPDREEHSFDELAKGIASDAISRCRVLKLAGAAILGDALSFLVLPDEAEARRGKHKHHR